MYRFGVVAALVIASQLAACGIPTAESESIPGVYLLRTLNGSSLPAPVPPNDGLEMTWGSITVGSDGAFTLMERRRRRTESGSVTEEAVHRGTFAPAQFGAVTFSFDDTGDGYGTYPLTGRISRDTITLEWSWIVTLEYRK